MTRRGPSARIAIAPVILGCASLLVAAPLSTWAQGGRADPSRVIQDFFVESASRQGEPQLLPQPPANPTAGERPAHRPDFVLSGVVIAGEARLALLQDTASSSGAILLPLGASLAGHRITDVHVDRVVLEAPGGQRLSVRLGAAPNVRGQGQAAPASAPFAEGAERAEPASAGNALSEPDSALAKHERQERIAEQTALDKARALMEQAAAPQPGAPSPPSTE
jgi:type II secretory pathway component PulC